MVLALGSASAACSAPDAEDESVTPVPASENFTGGTGAAPLGDAGCEQDEPTVVVDAQQGSDDAAGTASAPLRTASAAIERVPAGGVVALSSGVYHENVLITIPLTLCALPGHEVWFDGSRVADRWSREGTVWTTPFTHHFSARASFDADVMPADAFVNPARPMAAHPEMLFADGAQLRQVPEGQRPGEGEFAVHIGPGVIVTGTDPAGKEMRVSTLQKAITVAAPDVRLEGFGVRRYANSVATFGVIYLGRPGNILRNVRLEDLATIAITVSDDTAQRGSTVENVTVERAGMLAVHANWADGTRIANSRFVDSNGEGFNPMPVAGAIKITRSRDVTVEYNRIEGARDSPGIWLDEAVVGFDVRGNSVSPGGAPEAGTGILVELSSRGAITGNEVSGAGRAVVVFNSEAVDVTGNRLSDSGSADFWLAQDHRRQRHSGSAGRDPRFRPGDPTNTWTLRDVSIVGNSVLSGNRAPHTRLFLADDDDTVDVTGITVQGNTFTAPGAVTFATAAAPGADRARSAWLTEALEAKADANRIITTGK